MVAHLNYTDTINFTTHVSSLSHLRPLWLGLLRCLHVVAMVPAVNQQGSSFPTMSAEKVRQCWKSNDKRSWLGNSLV